MCARSTDTSKASRRVAPFVISMPSELIKLHTKRIGRLKKVPCMSLCKLLFAALPTIAFGVFTIVFTLQQDASARATREQDQRQADEINRRTMFKDYIDDVKDILLGDDFEYKMEKSLLHIRVQTLTVLENLDPGRKQSVIRFLYENRLLRTDEPMRLDLRGADLNGIRFSKSRTTSCHLMYLYLPGVYAENIVFDGCLLYSAVFDNASMAGAHFHSCNLMSSTFVSANLSQAKFDGNQLYQSNFLGAQLTQTIITGGLFQSMDLTNADLYQSSISHQLLFPSAVGGLGPNTFVNTRHPDGSYIHIDTQDLVVDGQAQSQCHLNWTSSWFTMSAVTSEKKTHTTITVTTPIAIVKDACFFRLDNQTNVFQRIDVMNFSVLINHEQAMFNLTAFVGLRYPDERDTIVMFVHFQESDGPFELTKSARKEIKGSAVNQIHSLSQVIPLNTRILVVWFTCELFSSKNQFCIFDQVKLSIFQKTP